MADLDVEQDQLLADEAHGVHTPFSERYIHNDSLSIGEHTYGLHVRNVGELAAGLTIAGTIPRVQTGGEVLRVILETAKIHSGPYSKRFLDDELAVAHAAQVYMHCVSVFCDDY